MLRTVNSPDSRPRADVEYGLWILINRGAKELVRGEEEYYVMLEIESVILLAVVRLPVFGAFIVLVCSSVDFAKPEDR